MFLTKIQDRTTAGMEETATCLRLGINLSLPSQRGMDEPCPRRNCPPVQLDLLPLHSCAPSDSHTSSATHTSCDTSLSWPPAPAVHGQRSMSYVGSPRDFDMNRIPSVADCENGIASSPKSIVSPFSLEAIVRRENSSSKREREGSHDLEVERRKNQEASSRFNDDDEGAAARKKLRLSKEQSALLEESFKEHITLNPKQKNALAKQLNLSARQVEVWFQNRRARTKLKQTEVDCELLKRCCESLTEENRRLQKELQELRAIKVAPPCVITHDFYMPLPAATLTMCPSCEKIATIDSTRSLTFSKPQYYPQFRQPSAAC